MLQAGIEAVDREAALNWIATVFEEPVGNLRPETTRDQIRGWDSMGMLTLMADLDEKFKIQLDENDVTSLRTVGDLLELLARHGALKA